MTILQPITTRAPSNRRVLEESGLPFSFVITPFAHRRSISNGDDDEFNESCKNKSGSYRDKRSKHNPSLSSTSRRSEFPTKASLIAKCTECGSPLNPTCKFVENWNILCNICGNVYDAHYYSQSRARRHEIDYYPEDFSDEEDDENYISSEEAEYLERYTVDFTQEECIKPVVEYSLPLLSVPIAAKGGKREAVYTLPAEMCPPLLAIFIDGTSSDPTYYARIAACLDRLIHGDEDDASSSDERAQGDKYKGARVGIFVMTQNGSLSVFDLANPGGHLKHLWVESSPLPRNPNYQKGISNLEDQEQKSKVRSIKIEEDEYAVAPLRDVMTADQIFASLDDNGISCIENAIRELADSRNAIQQACGRNYQGSSRDGNENDDDSGGVYLGRTLQYFLEFIEDVAYHPGDLARFDIEDEESSTMFMYAGGKIMCFLSKAPDEIGDIIIGNRNGRIGNGGFGGSCAEIGKRFTSSVDRGFLMQSDVHLHHSDDIESGAASGPTSNTNQSSVKEPCSVLTDDMLPQTKYLGVAEYYHQLGMASAVSAFGVEIFALVHEDDDEIGASTGEPFIGIPFLRLLSDRSGGCGPLISKLSRHEKKSDGIGSEDTFMNEVLSRCPWRR